MKFAIATIFALFLAGCPIVNAADGAPEPAENEIVVKYETTRNNPFLTTPIGKIRQFLVGK
jgi:hypothetical protein